jgi:hypothetical protein
VVAFTLLGAGARAAEAPTIEEVRAAWNACSTFMAKKSDDWIGWRRDFGNGYADYFELWDNSGEGSSLLRETFFIDGIAKEVQTSCFRPDGTLAFVFATMTSPNVATQGGNGPELVREGRIYVDPAGKVVRVAGQVTQGGKKVADMDTNKYSLARGCHSVDLHLTLDRARAHYEHEMGDIEGKHPDYAANTFDWCAKTKE